MNERNIVLSAQELEDIKDTIKFRTKVLIELKRLCNLPNQVTTLKVWAKVQWLLISVVMATLICSAIDGWTR